MHVRMYVCMYVANKGKVLHGIPRDPDLAAALVQMEEEENENMAEDEKPKVSPKVTSLSPVCREVVLFSEVQNGVVLCSEVVLFHY